MYTIEIPKTNGVEVYKMKGQSISQLERKYAHLENLVKRIYNKKTKTSDDRDRVKSLRDSMTILDGYIDRERERMEGRNERKQYQEFGPDGNYAPNLAYASGYDYDDNAWD